MPKNLPWRRWHDRIEGRGRVGHQHSRPHPAVTWPSGVVVGLPEMTRMGRHVAERAAVADLVEEVG